MAIIATISSICQKRALSASVKRVFGAGAAPNGKTSLRPRFAKIRVGGAHSASAMNSEVALSEYESQVSLDATHPR
jgi:hypothetical protein